MHAVPTWVPVGIGIMGRKMLDDPFFSPKMIQFFCFLQVSSSCTSVYVDGSETRGAISARIDVKYGQQVGQAQVIDGLDRLIIKKMLSPNESDCHL